MPKYIPAPAYMDSMPVDISFVFEEEKPAGKHGFLQVREGKFVFEDGTPVRFFGYNLAESAAFPPKAEAEMTAGRLSEMGCNLVRLHMLDFEESRPNIFSFSRGKRLENTLSLDPESMERLDYLIWCLKKEGIYLYLDLLDYRRFKTGDGVPFAKELGWAAKPYSIFDRRMIDLQKEYATLLWTHINPYTGLSYREDPAFALAEITNENDLFSRFGEHYPSIPYYEKEWRELYRHWLSEQGLTADWENQDLYEKSHPLVDFKLDLQKNYFREMKAHLSALGVRVPVIGTDWYHNAPGNALSEEEMDFTGGHHYYYDWRWGDEDRYSLHEPMTKYPYICPHLGATKLKDKPYVVSEFSMPWPNSFRAEGLLYYTTLAGIQGWDGLLPYMYSYTYRAEAMKKLGSQFSTETIGGISFESGCLAHWNDPVMYLLAEHCALILRRGDIAPAKTRVGVEVKDVADAALAPLKTLMEQHRVEMIFSSEAREGYDRIFSDEEEVPLEKEGVLQSDTGECFRDASKKIALVDTPRTKLIYGKLANGFGSGTLPLRTGQKPSPETRLPGFLLEAENDFGAVALSSLTEASIEKSDHLLLSALSRAANTGMGFDGTRMTSQGEAPILAEVVEATVRIRTERQDLVVSAVNAEGFISGREPASWEDGFLTFKIGHLYPALQYLITAE